MKTVLPFLPRFSNDSFQLFVSISMSTSLSRKEGTAIFYGHQIVYICIQRKNAANCLLLDGFKLHTNMFSLRCISHFVSFCWLWLMWSSFEFSIKMQLHFMRSNSFIWIHWVWLCIEYMKCWCDKIELNALIRPNCINNNVIHVA